MRDSDAHLMYFNTQPISTETARTWCQVSGEMPSASRRACQGVGGEDVGRLQEEREVKVPSGKMDRAAE